MKDSDTILDDSRANASVVKHVMIELHDEDNLRIKPNQERSFEDNSSIAHVQGGSGILEAEAKANDLVNETNGVCFTIDLDMSQ